MICEQGTQQRSANSEGKSSPNGWITFFTFILAVAAIAQFVAMWLQRGYMHKQWEKMGEQVVIAGNAADAAFLNATAVINAERPWMLINIKMDVGRDSNGMTFGISVPIGFSVSFINCGKTPAEVISFEQHLDCTQTTDDLPIPPEYQTPNEQVLRHTRLVAADGKWEDVTESGFSLQQNFPNDWADIYTSTKRAMYWGRLRYRDLIEQPRTIHEVKDEKSLGVHETCFCYFYSPTRQELLITGPRGYNKHT